MVQPLTSEWSLEQVLVEGYTVDVDQEHLVKARGFITCLVVDIELDGFLARRIRML